MSAIGPVLVWCLVGMLLVLVLAGVAIFVNDTVAGWRDDNEGYGP